MTKDTKGGVRDHAAFFLSADKYLQTYFLAHIEKTSDLCYNMINND